MDDIRLAFASTPAYYNYMASDVFAPAHEVALEAVKSLFLEESGSVVQ